MSAFYDDMALTAAEMIAEFGQPVMLSYSTPGEYDPVTRTNGPPVSAYVACVAMERAYKTEEIDGTVVVKGDKRLVLSARDASGNVVDEPPVGALITMAGDSEWPVFGVNSTNPGGEAVVFVLHLRR